MSVVVTGAAGFIGAALVRELAGAGYAVVAVDRRPVVGPRTGATVLRVGLLAGDPAAEHAPRLMAERDVRGPLNVGTGRPRTLAELAAAVHRQVAPSGPAHRPGAAPGGYEPGRTPGRTA